MAGTFRKKIANSSSVLLSTNPVQIKQEQQQTDTKNRNSSCRAGISVFGYLKIGHLNRRITEEGGENRNRNN